MRFATWISAARRSVKAAGPRCRRGKAIGQDPDVVPRVDAQASAVTPLLNVGPPVRLGVGTQLVCSTRWRRTRQGLGVLASITGRCRQPPASDQEDVEHRSGAKCRRHDR